MITPPLLQPNTPYSATPLLTAWLRANNITAIQTDLSLELLSRLFSTDGIDILHRELLSLDTGNAPYFLTQAPRYRAAVNGVMRLLRGLDSDDALRLCRRGTLPEGPQLENAWRAADQLYATFGQPGREMARHLASRFLDDIADAATVADPHFAFSRYAEKPAVYLPQFAPMKQTVEESDTIFTRWLDELTDEEMRRHSPDITAITVPFPGCLFGALRIARRIKRQYPNIHVTLGGGYINTELRNLRDPAIFDFIDSITFDSGMRPLQRLIEYTENGGNRDRLVRTMMNVNGKLEYFDSGESPTPHNSLPAPIYDGLHIDRYFGLMETLNPVTRLWSDGKWNRLLLAHGCCWSRCAFCDTSLDYIRRYDPAEPKTICDWMESMVAHSGHSGFHFVDESLPPDLISNVCDEILERNMQVSWWGNIRFEKRFSSELIGKMAAAGCIAVTGGLETVCDRTLKLMHKGISVKGATYVMENLANAGILVHAYLMYGFPTQTKTETYAAIETVDKLFESGILHSAYWHRFALTAHSEIASHPDRFSIILLDELPATFARNEIPFDGHFEYDLDSLPCS